MLKALLKKQLLEIKAQFFRNRRTGKSRSALSAALFISLLALSMIGISAMFFFLAKTILTSASESMLFIYYFVMGLIAIAIGILGSVFNSYFTVFEAKDNDLLLSLPIPPNRIVFARAVSVALMAMLYESTVLVPTFLVRLIYRKVSVLAAINTFFLYFFVTAFVVALSLALGFVVAAIVRKVKRKSLFTVVASVLTLGVYYLIYFRAQSAIMRLIAMTSVPKAVKNWMFLFYHMGLAAEGDPLSMLIFCSIVSALFVLAYFLLTKNYLRFSISKKAKDSRGKKGKIRSSSVDSALLSRELRRYASSPNYILNASFGTLMMIVAGVFFFIKAKAIRALAPSFLSPLFPKSNGLIVAALLVCLLVCGNDLTAPSVTLEGKSVWILRSLPVRATQIFKAKIKMHLVLTLPPALFVSAAALVAIGANAISVLLHILLLAPFVLFTAEYGLVLNLIKPSLNWTSEIVAIKESPVAFISVFSEYLLAMGLALLYLPLSDFMWEGYYLLILAILFTGIDVGLAFWLKKTGVKKFEALS